VRGHIRAKIASSGTGAIDRGWLSSATKQQFIIRPMPMPCGSKYTNGKAIAAIRQSRANVRKMPCLRILFGGFLCGHTEVNVAIEEFLRGYERGLGQFLVVSRDVYLLTVLEYLLKGVAV